MRIVYLHQYFRTPASSGSTRSWEMARRLVAAGHEVQMVTSWREPTTETDWFRTEEEGIHVHWLPVPYSNHMGHAERVRAFVRFAWASARKAASLESDVVFATSTPLTIAIPGIWASRRRGVPMVFEVRDLWPELPIAVGALRNPVSRGLARALERWAYRSSSAVVALSPMMRDGVVSAGFPEERVAVIPNSADLDLFDPAASDPRPFLDAHPELAGRPIVLYAGTMGPINGVGYLVDIARAAAERGRTDVAFVVMGRGAQEELVRRRAAEQGVLGTSFFLYPPVPKASMPGVLAAADVALSLFVDLRPMWANSANKFFDGLASGTPMAINYGGWQADLLRETGAGVVLPPASPAEAAGILLGRLADGTWLREAGRRARRLAEERFDRDELASRLERVLVEAVNGRSGVSGQGPAGVGARSVRPGGGTDGAAGGPS